MVAIIYILLYALLYYSCEAYKVLVVFPMPSRSHSILGNGIVKHLLIDDVEVTYVSVFDYKDPPKNLRLIDISDNFKVFSASNTLNLTLLLDKNIPIGSQHIISPIMTKIASTTIKNKNVQKLLNDPNEQFDVVIVEWMFSDVLSGLATLFGCPLIWATPTDVNAQSISLIDTALNPAFSGYVLTVNAPPFSFLQRIEELWVRLKSKFNNLLYYDDLEANEYKTLLAPLIKKRGREPPSYYDVRYNASLVLGTSHVSMGIALPLPQNYKAVGGYHIEDDVKPLPKDLQKIMDDAKDGVIYFSMGSNLKSKDWPEKIKTDLLKMFGGLKQIVLWKFEEKMANTPKNVHILQWAPQQSILSHDNLRVFVSHGGLLSTTETIFHGVPIIGIPVFGDQFANVRKAVHKGFAKEVELSYNLVNDLKEAIEEVLSNPKYRQTAKELSYIYHDRPIKPGVEIAHWVRHVVNTRGALHLRSPSLHVPLYQQLYLDLAALLAIILALSLLVLRLICSTLCSKNTNKQKKH